LQNCPFQPGTEGISVASEGIFRLMTRRLNAGIVFLLVAVAPFLTACSSSSRTELIQKEQTEDWRILVQSDGELYFLDLGASSITPIGLEPDPDHSHRTGTFDPTGASVAYTYGWDSLGIFDLTTRKSESLMTIRRLKDAWWSPNGKDIAVKALSAPAGNFDLYLYHLSDRSSTLLVNGELSQGYGGVSWAPDGKAIAYEDSEFNICIMNLETKGRTKLDIGTSPTWSPSGRYIAYEVVDKKSKNPGFVIYDLQSGKKQRILGGENIISGLIWSPDSRYVLFSRLSRGLLATWVAIHGDDYWGDLYVLDLESGAQSRVYRQGETIVPVDWAKTNARRSAGAARP
jgi:WD40 repeat protein